MKFFVLFASLVLLLLAYPYVEAPLIAMLIPVASVYALSDRKRHWVVAAILAIPTLVGLAGTETGVHVVPPAVWHLSALCLFAFTTGVVSRRVMASRRVTTDELYGAAAVYLLMGVTWTIAYLALEHVRPGSFVLPDSRPATFPDLLYFSYVTLSTVGYGDIRPATDGARSLALLEAVSGVMYIAISVARLLGFHLSRRDATGR